MGESDNLSTQNSETYFREKAIKFAVNDTSGILALGVEIARWSQFNMRGREKFGTTTPLPLEPLLTIMQSLGDAGPGFFISAFAYEAIDILTIPVERITRKKVPEEAKIGASVLLGIAAIVAHEKGKFISDPVNNGNVLDMLGGAIGPVAFAGCQIILNRLIKKIDIQIETEKNRLIDSGIKASDLDLIG